MSSGTIKRDIKRKDVLQSNILAGEAVRNCIRTALGPKGSDKLIQTADGETLVTNDGATIVKSIGLFHPVARMLKELSEAQDVEAGDGTTSVVVLAGSLLGAVKKLTKANIHSTQISNDLGVAMDICLDELDKMSIKIDLTNREELLNAAITSMSSKIINENSNFLAAVALDAVMAVINPETAVDVDLKDIKMIKVLGGTIEDTELHKGLVLQNTIANKIHSVKNAKIALAQFHLSAPKSDIENNIVITEYEAMDRLLKQERKYIFNLCKKIKKSGANVVLLQKSILRDSLSTMAVHFLNKFKIMVVKDVERSDMEHIAVSLNAKPVAHIDSLSADKLGHADLVAQETVPSGAKFIRFSGVKDAGKTCTIICRASSTVVLDETERSIHDALCVMRCFVKKRGLIVGGGAPEIAMSRALMKKARLEPNKTAFSLRAFADALEMIPFTLAENAGLNPMAVVTELRACHEEGKVYHGINVKRGAISDMKEENVVQPLLVNTSAISLAIECVRMITKIDDLIPVV